MPSGTGTGAWCGRCRARGPRWRADRACRCGRPSVPPRSRAPPPPRRATWVRSACRPPAVLRSASFVRLAWLLRLLRIDRSVGICGRLRTRFLDQRLDARAVLDGCVQAELDLRRVLEPERLA